MISVVRGTKQPCVVVYAKNPLADSEFESAIDVHKSETTSTEST